MPENADIDTGVQRIWGQSEQVPQQQQQQQQRDGGRFAAGLDFFGVTPDANSLSLARTEVTRNESESVWSGVGAVGLRGVGAVLAEGGAGTQFTCFTSTKVKILTPTGGGRCAR
jgi:hypothetical protein